MIACFMMALYGIAVLVFIHNYTPVEYVDREVKVPVYFEVPVEQECKPMIIKEKAPVCPDLKEQFLADCTTILSEDGSIGAYCDNGQIYRWSQ